MAYALSRHQPPVTFDTPADRGPEHRIELVARLFVGSLAAVTFGLAGCCALRGYGPVLPFAGLDIGLLAWAVRASMRRSAEREVIVVSEADVVIERLAPSGSRRTVFPRHWARVTLRDPRPARHPSRLTIESRGRACEVGRFLTEDERRRVAARLARLVGKTSESTALAP